MRLALLAALASLAAAAAGSSAAAAPPDPCVLITVKDATPVFGATPSKPTRTQAGGVRSCTYAVKREKMTVATRALASESAFVATTKAIKGLVLPIETLKDAYSTSGGKMMLLWKGGTEITFTFAGFNPVFAVQATLANTALGRV
jgi:hypothetical protein